MTDLSFTCTGVRAEPYAAGPTLVFRLRIAATGTERVHAIALRCQIRIEPERRRYERQEADRLTDLLGERSRWGSTLHPLQFAQASVVVPGFTGETEVDLPVPCTYDMDIASSKYFAALDDGEAPMLLLFSGTAFCGAGGFQVHPIPWNKEAACRMPVHVWRETIDHHFPDCGWLRLPRAAMDALQEYRSRHGLPSWEATVHSLLDASRPDSVPAPARAGASSPLTAEGTA